MGMKIVPGEKGNFKTPSLTKGSFRRVTVREAFWVRIRR